MKEAVMTYFQSNTDEFMLMLSQHLKISAVAVIFGILIGVTAGIFASASKKLNGILSGTFGIFRVIPSLAVLFVCIPIFGVGVIPAIIALTVLAVPPILINTAAAFRTLPESVLETALGMGMDSKMIFLKVKIPLAMPLMLTGIKTAAVEVISSATLAAYIGAGGLGNIIFTGLGLYRMDLLFIGGISVAMLSLITDWIFSIAEWSITKYNRV